MPSRFRRYQTEGHVHSTTANDSVKETVRHMPELDGIRGLAILGVLCSHGVSVARIFERTPVTPASTLLEHILTPLWGGVDLFFVLSGFLITGILLRTKQNRNYFSSFYGRRVLRIFPLYYLVLIVTSVVGHFSLAVSALLPSTHLWKIAYFVYLQNWPIFWAHGAKGLGGLWGVFWSLAAEEQFYFVWPIVVLLFSEKTVTRICYVGFACALPLRIFLSVHSFSDHIGLAQLTSSRVDGLLIGAAIAVFTFQHKRPVPMPVIVFAASAGSVIMGYIALFHNRELVSTSYAILTYGITAYALLGGALVAVSQHHIPLLQRALTQGWLRAFGKYSYGIYVYHLLIMVPVYTYMSSPAHAALRFSLAQGILLLLCEIAVVFVLAALSFHLIESPILRLKRHFNPA